MTAAAPGTEAKGEIVPVQEKELASKKSASMILDLAEAKEWYRSFNEFKEAVIESNKNFTAEINVRGQKKRLINRAGWRAIAQAFHLNDEILKTEVIHHPDGKNFTVAVTGRVYHQASGRSVDCVGAASTDEPGKGWPPTYHNCFAIAHTRMKNRGISDIVGSGEPSSDEFIAGESEERQPTEAELAAREKAKSMGKPQPAMPQVIDGKVLCPDCQSRFTTFDEMAVHRKESHSK